jgi:hypothetical protein
MNCTPSLNDCNNIPVFVDSTIIHHNNRIWTWIWLHFIKESLYELAESFSTKGPLHNAAVKNAISE